MLANLQFSSKSYLNSEEQNHLQQLQETFQKIKVENQNQKLKLEKLKELSIFLLIYFTNISHLLLLYLYLLKYELN